jgi:predicted DNA-binding WGR domain protein
MRLELSDGTSNKFWEIDRAGKVLHIRYGRLGTSGQTVQKSFATPEAATREHDKLIASKRKKGYAPSTATRKAAPKTVNRAQTIKASGRAAKTLGALQATEAALSVIAADATDVVGWRGAGPTGKDGPIAVGAGKGVRAHIGARSGWSGVWATKYGVALVDVSVDANSVKQRNRALAQRVAQWPVTVRPKVIGKLINHSGVIALMLPQQSGTFSSRDLAKATSGAVVADPKSQRI